MARSIWTGSISFGLVNVPVKAYTAVRDHTVHFNQLEKETGARVHQQLVSEKTGEVVEREDLELGYEISSGRYVTFEREELEDLRPTSTRAVEVGDFVALDDIDPIYYERTYWLGPDGDTAADAYQLLRAAMEERGQAAVGTVVMRNKQYLAAIRPLDGVLAMSTMRFEDEVVPKADIDELPSRTTKPDPKTLKLALQIVDSLASEWDPKRYHDTYSEQLHDIIDRKDKGKETVVSEAPAQTAQVVDLMAALQASVAASKQGKGRAGTAKALANAAEDLADEVEQEEASDDGSTRSSSTAGGAKKRASANSRTGAKKRTGTAKTAGAKKATNKPTRKSTVKKAARRSQPTRRSA